MKIVKAVDEFNQGGHLIHVCGFVGAYVRGKTREEALKKLGRELRQYCLWQRNPFSEEFSVEFVEEKESELQIADADSDVLLEGEDTPLTLAEYQALKAVALKSARDFQALYESVPQKDVPLKHPRGTFYGSIPVTAEEMYEHTKNVNDYYFGEIDVSSDHEGDILSCRIRGFERLEKMPDFLKNGVLEGSYGENWSLRKVCRRFVWHDRIHARALYRAAVKRFGREKIANPFCFEES